MTILADKQDSCRLLPEVVATAAAICDKWAARQENVSQISPNGRIAKAKRYCSRR
jgi:hypothetical protein